MKGFNARNHKHDKDVNDTSKYNLLNYIPNPSKHTKNTRTHYSLILHGCMNTRRGRAKYRTFKSCYIVDVIPRL